MGETILIVDDEALIALDMETALEGGGFTQELAVAHDVQSAMAVLESKTVVCAVLDAHLHGESAEALAQRLRSAPIPFVVTTGYSADHLEWLDGAPMLTKPVDPADLADTVRALLTDDAT